MENSKKSQFFFPLVIFGFFLFYVGSSNSSHLNSGNNLIEELQDADFDEQLQGMDCSCGF